MPGRAGCGGIGVTCHECQERLLSVAGAAYSDCSEHLTRCAACRDFAHAAAAVGGPLRGWDLPVSPSDTASARAALVARLAEAPKPAVTPLDRPLLPTLLGSLAAVLGIGLAPDWARGILLGWLAVAGLSALLVLLQSAWRGARQGDTERWIPQTID
jgi:hypothetical protein